MSSAIMIGPLLDSVTGLTSKPSFLKKPAPRATAVGKPVFQLGDGDALELRAAGDSVNNAKEQNDRS
jgi:hypothetical protein